MRLFAINDLHLANRPNRTALRNFSHYTDDWLILAGDIGGTTEHLKFALSILTFTLNEFEVNGENKYQQLVKICQSFNVITPED